MPVRKFSILFFIFSIIAGVIGALLGEWLLESYYGIWPNLLLIGVYFGQLAFLAGLFCLLAEIISPVINGQGWRREYTGLSWKVLIPSTLVMLFAAGLLFQFLYSVNFSNIKPPDDLVVVLDISGSMNETDPKHESLKAAGELISTMKPTNRAAIISFNDQAFVTKPMFNVNDKTEKADGIAAVNSLDYNGDTDIGNALDIAMQEMDANQQAGRKPMVILFSDGYSELDLNAVLEPYQSKDIAIHTIGMSQIDRSGAQLLKLIASNTGGSFYDVKNASQLKNIYEKIYLENQDRLLVAERHGVFKTSLWLSILRVVLVTFIGGLFGLALGIVFDNSFLAKSYSITGLIMGLVAGLVLELSLQDSAALSGFYYRLTADILLTAATGLGTLLIPIREKFSGGVPHRSGRSDVSLGGSSKRRDPLNKGF
ncbi:VWA domain-containing protein [Bacillus sp. FJAT-29814]|uniref:vWA domain-containing protein n=1 Tax=Bacillus sp. FJAT-29814 TaxID=1729688 RepID=UPI0008305777|nr:VWA domain-containing protein [Bacillus sp. FJAT-29814]